MNLIWRFLWILVKSRFAPLAPFFNESRLTLHVLLSDIDIIGHMNNGRYLSLMDLGRVDFMIRSDIWAKLRAKNIYPVVASAMIRYKKSLMLWQKFDLTTQLLGWDEKFFYILQRFIANQEIYTISVVKTRFILKGKGSIDPGELFKLIEMQIDSPKLPTWVTAWNLSDKDFFTDAMSR